MICRSPCPQSRTGWSPRLVARPERCIPPRHGLLAPPQVRLLHRPWRRTRSERDESPSACKSLCRSKPSARSTYCGSKCNWPTCLDAKGLMLERDNRIHSTWHLLQPIYPVLHCTCTLHERGEVEERKRQSAKYESPSSLLGEFPVAHEVIKYRQPEAVGRS